jgi:hypothetical protein
MARVFLPFVDQASLEQALWHGVTPDAAGRCLVPRLRHHERESIYAVIPVFNYPIITDTARFPVWAMLDVDAAGLCVYNRELHGAEEERYARSCMTLETFSKRVAAFDVLLRYQRLNVPGLSLVYLDACTAETLVWQPEPEPPIDIFAHDDEIPPPRPWPRVIDYLPELRLRSVRPEEFVGSSLRGRI